MFFYGLIRTTTHEYPTLYRHHVRHQHGRCRCRAYPYAGQSMAGRAGSCLYPVFRRPPSRASKPSKYRRQRIAPQQYPVPDPQPPLRANRPHPPLRTKPARRSRYRHRLPRANRPPRPRTRLQHPACRLAPAGGTDRHFHHRRFPQPRFGFGRARRAAGSRLPSSPVPASAGNPRRPQYRRHLQHQRLTAAASRVRLRHRSRQYADGRVDAAQLAAVIRPRRTTRRTRRYPA